MRELHGKSLVLLGQFEGLSRGMVSRYLNVMGARLKPRLEPGTELVVAGQRSGALLSTARRRGLPILREQELLDALGLVPESATLKALVHHAWDRIERWLGEHAPALLEELPGPAEPVAIETLEDLLGRPLPADLAESYRRHDGAPLVYGGEGWLSTAGMALTWERLCEDARVRAEEAEAMDPRVQALHWSPMWLPIWNSGLGDHQAIDGAPAAGGRVGQIVDCRWGVPAQREVNADGFVLWLSAFAHELELGRYAFNGRSLILRKTEGERG